MTPAPRAFLLADHTDGALAEAAEVLQLDVVSVQPAALLPAAIDAHASARAIVVATDDPSLLRAIVEHASARRIPVILAGADDVAYRRAIEFRVNEWYPTSATPVEVTWRIRSAIARVAVQAIALSHRIDQVEYEEMLYDPLTGMATLPGDARAHARADQGSRRGHRLLSQLHSLLEDRGDLRLGEARSGARDHRGRGARIPRRQRARHHANDGRLRQR